MNKNEFVAAIAEKSGLSVSVTVKEPDTQSETGGGGCTNTKGRRLPWKFPKNEKVGGQSG